MKHTPTRTTPATRDQADQVPLIGEVTQRATVVKCMGRTYTAAAAGTGTVRLDDVTDPTHPLPLGTAHPASGEWEVHDRTGAHLTSTGDLLYALALLRQHEWPAPAPGRPGTFGGLP
ncbi:hypothetical protein ACIA8O_36635 [Kitasatospora sp. NPDC051853]|uniref:hypothetical protein n=1 Tax=Kitasatospora sp. NPDC051853 TaxID=3364058 RepID=UPI003787F371